CARYYYGTNFDYW
nr:immunoglobulin heavy chain junction region [Mus musculus]